MKKLIELILVSISSFLLMACSKQSNISLDGEYYWINENRNEVAFVISGDTGTIKHEEAEGFTIDKEKSTIQLLGENIIKLTKSYTFKDDVFTVDISGMRHDYYKKDSKAYQKALKKYGYQ
ncbi:hypothetical protein B7692_04345 [Streptococcus mitis]|uniref:Lipoprotein n=1 Tax=Streptococcus mitis TaxID=28037 RepID=A0A1X1L7W1_STRMT|nr:hypothetical protein [Streptococcus mitis]ORP07562.1 hypothetical protein B7692_04345 [Streptococcus mitis]